MANKDAAFGFKPVRIQGGAAYNASMASAYYCTGATGAMYIGMPVVGTGTANAAAIETYGIGELEGVTPATAGTGNGILGVIVGFGPNRDDLTKQYRPTSTDRIVYVCDHPHMIYIAQEDSVSENLAVTDSGDNVNFAGTSGSTISGKSTAELDSDSSANTATLQFKLLRLAPIPDNAVGTNAVWEVMINNHTRDNNIVGA
jgi:hypothetical protein